MESRIKKYTALARCLLLVAPKAPPQDELVRNPKLLASLLVQNPKAIKRAAMLLGITPDAVAQYIKRGMVDKELQLSLEDKDLIKQMYLGFLKKKVPEKCSQIITDFINQPKKALNEPEIPLYKVSKYICGLKSQEEFTKIAAEKGISLKRMKNRQNFEEDTKTAVVESYDQNSKVMEELTRLIQ
ncbi:Hypothetical_protein [Hexamita inflata]|uniref:Hypothetical_protein n=1 Tax=Hexamita inflata TaxID=28002 RepID=A0AA86NX08_9EUKA|nr:Hypothetical protein HINF_LOCUS15079 [Hexamita inflata]